MANEQQADFWSGPGGQSWVDNQTQMDTMLQLQHGIHPVSYTHLTLPTICSV